MLHDSYQRPLRDLRISVTDRCNFRCPYCMPAEIFGERYRFLPKAHLLRYEEIARLVRLFTRLGVVKVRLTGGEPLMRRDLETLVAQLAAITGIEDLALTTNGFFLPQKASALRSAGLKRITVSLDSLDDAVFRRMNGGRAGVQDVLAGIDAAAHAGFHPIKINAVVQRGVNDHTIVDLARFCKAQGYIARFIEYMDVGNLNGWSAAQVVSADEMAAMIGAVMPLAPMLPNYPGEVARRYRYQDGGEVGFIASVTKPFCGACTRLRLSAEGRLYTCLFATRGTDLKGPLRAGASDADLEQIVRRVWGARADQYSERRGARAEAHDPQDAHKVEMFHIGG